MKTLMRPHFPTRHHGAPCHEQPGKQQWHLACILRHPARFLRSIGPRALRYGGAR